MRTRSLLALIPLVALAACFDAECEDDDVLVDIDSLPAAVTDAIEAEYPGSTLMEAEEEDGGYEIEVRDADGTLWEVEVTEAGAIVEVEEDDDGDEDDCDDSDGDEDDDGGDDDDDGDDDD